jgi:hypothetical protein
MVKLLQQFDQWQIGISQIKRRVEPRYFLGHRWLWLLGSYQ